MDSLILLHHFHQTSDAFPQGFTLGVVVQHLADESRLWLLPLSKQSQAFHRFENGRCSSSVLPFLLEVSSPLTSSTPPPAPFQAPTPP
jgi:hypothetical protein